MTKSFPQDVLQKRFKTLNGNMRDEIILLKRKNLRAMQELNELVREKNSFKF